ncbi:MAG TPA: alpha/beta hydrolase-fold protein [Bryobacteraceae bacterium]|nr:alpha/beta hydrolase-fold protein [Bryobacteraceae bacterium]
MFLRTWSALLLLSGALFAQPAAAPSHLFYHVVVGPEFGKPVSGRLLVFLSKGSGAKEVDASEANPGATWVAAREVESVPPGGAVDIDTDGLAFPAGFSTLAPGDYQAQAVLDVDHSYPYTGRSAGDLISPVVSLPGFSPRASRMPAFTLHATVPEPPQPSAAAGQVERFVSPALSGFWGRPISMRAVVLLPPGYRAHPRQRYPAVYFTHGFGGNLQSLQRTAVTLLARMESKQMPEMIWVLLDESSPTGTHEFADSVNNGPWGHALVREFIPYLESKYRLDPRAGARFLNGHSSGGWATLWLQVTYPKTFGGTWSTSPDPGNFHDFSGIDLYASPVNMYRTAEGKARPIVRMQGQVAGTWETLARLERVLGSYGGQIASFEWVFSPRGQDGRPMPLFDRTSGEVDPQVARAWTKFDISRIVAASWPAIGPDLRGKIHLIVGTQDTFYLDGPAHKLQAVLDSLHANAHFTFLEGRSHFDVYKVGNDPRGLFDEISKEMYHSWRSTAARSAAAAAQ